MFHEGAGPKTNYLNRERTSIARTSSNSKDVPMGATQGIEQRTARTAAIEEDPLVVELSDERRKITWESCKDFYSHEYIAMTSINV